MAATQEELDRLSYQDSTFFGRKPTFEEYQLQQQQSRDLDRRMRAAGLTSFEGVIVNEDGTFSGITEED